MKLLFFSVLIIQILLSLYIAGTTEKKGFNRLIFRFSDILNFIKLGLKERKIITKFKYFLILLLYIINSIGLLILFFSAF
jgi:hypothetical protein